VSQKSSSPSGFAIAHSPGNNCRRQTLDWATTCINDSCLTGQSLATNNNSDQIARTFLNPSSLDQSNLTFVTIDIKNIFSKAPRGRTRIKISLNHNCTVNNVESAGESQNGRYFRFPATHFGYRNPAEFVLHRSGH
jgi:hypothetical protein